MDGSAELRQLAHLLRVAAITACDIATMRKHNESEIAALARQMQIVADDFDQIVAQPFGDGRSAMAHAN